MKLLYTTSITLPSYRANRVQITSMARALVALLGDNFILGIGSAADDSLKGVRVISTGEGVRSYMLAWKYLRYAKREQITHIYCREEKLLFLMMLYNRFFFWLPLTFCYELHHLVYMDAWWHRIMLRMVEFIVSITSPMKQIIAKSGYPADHILVAPDAVDMILFDIKIGKDDARKKLGLPMDKKIVIYAGAIDEPWKGVGVLYEASKHFDDSYFFLILGGKPHYVEWFHSQYPPRSNFVLVGHKPHRDIPLYLRSADVAVLPNSKKNETSRISTSPMKLFEYMASGVPIVASDLPSIREILNEKNSFMVQPDVAADLTRGIRAVTENSQLGTMLATQALKDVSIYTWEARAQKIISFLQ